MPGGCEGRQGVCFPTLKELHPRDPVKWTVKTGTHLLRPSSAMDENMDVPGAQSGTSHRMGNAAASDHGDIANPMSQLRSQILELGISHDEVLTTIASMNNVTTRSYVYIPREKQIVPFCGGHGKDNIR